MYISSEAGAGPEGLFFFFHMIYYYYYYYLKIYCDQHINILHLLELIQVSTVRLGCLSFCL